MSNKGDQEPAKKAQKVQQTLFTFLLKKKDDENQVKLQTVIVNTASAKALDTATEEEATKKLKHIDACEELYYIEMKHMLRQKSKDALAKAMMDASTEVGKCMTENVG